MIASHLAGHRPSTDVGGPPHSSRCCYHPCKKRQCSRCSTFLIWTTGGRGGRLAKTHEVCRVQLNGAQQTGSFVIFQSFYFGKKIKGKCWSLAGLIPWTPHTPTVIFPLTKGKGSGLPRLLQQAVSGGALPGRCRTPPPPAPAPLARGGPRSLGLVLVKDRKGGKRSPPRRWPWRSTPGKGGGGGSVSTARL